jgi:hypothetical protein
MTDLSETTVYIPEKINEYLKFESRQEAESQGVLVYREHSRAGNEGDIFVEYKIPTGRGTPGQVESQQEKLDVLHQFMEENPEYRGIVYHTHSEGTLDEFGEVYGHNFSPGDMASIEDTKPPKYDDWELLFTPDWIISSEEWQEITGSRNRIHNFGNEEELRRVQEEGRGKPEIVVSDWKMNDGTPFMPDRPGDESVWRDVRSRLGKARMRC